MTSSTAAADPRHSGCLPPPVPEAALAITGEGLVLGSTVLAKMGCDGDGRLGLALDGAEERILALLAIAYGTAVRPNVLGNIRRTATRWRQSETVLAAIELALAGLPPRRDLEAVSRRLSLGEQLLAVGMSPRQLVEACGVDPVPLGLIKAGFNPDEPRVPAGNPDGGQWTSSGAWPAEVDRLDPGVEAIAYTPVHGLPDDAIIVTTPNGKPIPDPDSKTKEADGAAPRRLPRGLCSRPSNRHLASV
jgi:hypothetical protein